jgi:hypothetical protein
MMEFHFKLGLFGWWCFDKLGNKVYLYFDSKKRLEEAKQRMKNKYAQKIQFWEVSNSK